MGFSARVGADEEGAVETGTRVIKFVKKKTGKLYEYCHINFVALALALVSVGRWRKLWKFLPFIFLMIWQC